MSDGRCSSMIAIESQPNHYQRHTVETWLKLRAEYVAGKGFLRELAPKYGIPVQTALWRCAKEKWGQARQAFVHRKTHSESPPDELPPVPVLPPQADVVARRIHRLELQLERIDLMIDEANDAGKLDHLASARARLFEQWRILSGVPKPGVRKPSRDRRPVSGPATSDIAPGARPITEVDPPPPAAQPDPAGAAEPG